MRLKVALMFALGILCAPSSCKPKSDAPSPEFTTAMAAFQSTLSRTVDPSYGDPAFDDVEALLRAVPKSAIEFDTANALAEEIQAGRERARTFSAQLAEDAERTRASATDNAVADEGEKVPDETAVGGEAVFGPKGLPSELPPSGAMNPAFAAEMLKKAKKLADEAKKRTEEREAMLAREASRPDEPVILYVTSWCGFCRKAKAYLDREHIEYRDHDIEREPSAREEMADKLARNGMASGGVPVIDVGGELIQGFSESHLGAVLKKKGYR